MENCPVGWRTVAAAVACTVLFAPASTMASSGVADPPNLTPAAKRQLAIDKRASAIYNRATARVVKRRPSCRPSPPPLGPLTVAGAPLAATLELLGVLRGPAAPGDDALPFPAGVTRIYIQAARTVTTPSGLALRVAPFQQVFAATPSEACRNAQASLARRLAAREPRVIRRAVESLIQDINEIDAAAPKPTNPPPDSVLIAGGTGDGRFGSAAVDMAEFAERGLLTSTKSTAIGLVPDGVASVELVFPREVRYGKFVKPIIHPSEERVTTQVQNNVFEAKSPRSDIETVFATSMVWRSASGEVLRTVPSRTG